MVTPYNYTITLKENRNFAFSGRTKAGYFDFYSNRRNLFLYEEFQLRLPEIDSIQFMAIDIPKSSKTGKINPKLVKIESQIEQVSGTLQIDHPQTNQGVKTFKIPYPVFKPIPHLRMYFTIARGDATKPNILTKVSIIK